MATFNGTGWTSVNFSSPQYAQAFQQLIADLYTSYQVGGYYVVSNPASRASAVGSQTWPIVVDSNYFGPGAFVIITSNANPTTNYCAGVVTAVTPTQLTVNSLVSAGSTPDNLWNISVIGSIRTTAPGSTRMGQTGQTTAAGALAALNIDNISNSAEAIYDDFMGAVTPALAGVRQMDRWLVTQTNGGVMQPNAAIFYAGDTAVYNLVPGAIVASPAPTDWAAHPGVLALETSVPNDAIKLQYGVISQIPSYGISNTSSFVLDVHVKIPTANSFSDFFTFSAGLTNGTMLVSDGIYIVIGRGIGITAMAVYVLQIASGVFTWTTANYTLVAGSWYTLRLQRTSITVIASDNGMAINPHPVILGTNTFTASTISLPLSPGIAMNKSVGSNKRAVLVDYYAFKPGALTR